MTSFVPVWRTRDFQSCHPMGIWNKQECAELGEGKTGRRMEHFLMVLAFQKLFTQYLPTIRHNAALLHKGLFLPGVCNLIVRHGSVKIVSNGR